MLRYRMGHNKYKMFNFLKGEYNYKFLDISHFFEFQSYTVIFCQQSHNCLVLSHVFFHWIFHLHTYVHTVNMTYFSGAICFLFKNKWRSFLSEQMHIHMETIKRNYVHYVSIINPWYSVKKSYFSYLIPIKGCL